MLSNDETNALFEVVTDYTYALDTLDNYDYERLTIQKTTKEEPFHATYENAMEAIDSLREKFGGSTLFGNEKDDSFKSSIGQIYQTFGGEELYPSVEEKAAMLLYLVTKNHSFSDGNKRITATQLLGVEPIAIGHVAVGHHEDDVHHMLAFLLKTAHSLRGLYLDPALLPGLQTVLILKLAD